MLDMSELVREFVVECTENLDKLDRDFVALERAPSDAKLLTDIFRYIHSIKGTAGCLGYSRLEAVAHRGENLLSRMREGELQLNQALTSGLLQMVDALRALVDSIDKTNAEGEQRYDALLLLLDTLNGADPHAASAASVSEELDESDAAAPTALNGNGNGGASNGEAASAVNPAEHLAGPTGGEEVNGASASRNGGASQDSTVRVDVSLLQKLMNLVGELVLTRNQILQHAQKSEDAGLTAASQKLNLLTSELQEGVMKTRMQPISGVWSKLPRIVRDVSKLCDKQVRLEMEGEDTELDRTIIEAIKDPLTHIVRNSIDHGIEHPADRYVAGKPEEGLISLSAFHEGGQVNIVIKDDGAGLNTDRIRQKALERGLVSAEQLAGMGEAELVQLVFLPGFSTAEQVTNISGRGVGMDVVKSYIERIGGSIDLQSVRGKGTNIRIRIPLTLAIVPALVVACRGYRYALPQINVLELVRIEPNADGTAPELESLHGAMIYRLRGRLIPLVFLDKLLGLPPEEAGARKDAIYVVVLQADDRTYGLVVDRVIDTQEIVVKPLGRQFHALEVYAGATIMGDGSLAMILDGAGIARRARVRAHEMAAAANGSNSVAALASECVPLLVASAEDGARIAFPLNAVERLEHIVASAVEVVGSERVTQYRGQIMPMIGNEWKGMPETSPDGIMQVVVCTCEGSFVGYQVSEVLDIVNEPLEVRRPSTRRGIACVSVVQGKVTEIVDVGGLPEQRAKQEVAA